MSDIRLYVDEDAEQRALVDGLRDRDVGEKIWRLVDLVNTKTAEEMRNQIEFL